MLLEDIIARKASFPKFEPPLKLYVYGRGLKETFGEYDARFALPYSELRALEYGVLSLFKGLHNVPISPGRDANVLDEQRLSQFFPLQGIKDQTYLIGIVWGGKMQPTSDEYTPALDLFGFSNFKGLAGRDWQESNPTVKIWQRVGESWMSTPTPELCGNGLIIFSEEEKFRRETASLRDYIEQFPSKSSYAIKRSGVTELVFV